MIVKKAYVLGDNTSHSLSPIIFNYWLHKYKVSGKYDYIEIPKNQFKERIKPILEEVGLCGLNITIPYKEKIIQHLNSTDKHVKKIGAVNCVSKINNKFFGMNTDWVGFKKSLNEDKTKTLKKETAIVIGYGGAAKAIIYSLIAERYKKIKVFVRSLDKIKTTNQQQIFFYNIKDLKNHSFSTDLIINTTPKDPLKNFKIQFDNKTQAYDINYQYKETHFLNHFGDKNKNNIGISMLVYQAVPCFKMWFGVTPKPDQELFTQLNKLIK